MLICAHQIYLSCITKEHSQVIYVCTDNQIYACLLLYHHRVLGQQLNILTKLRLLKFSAFHFYRSHFIYKSYHLNYIFKRAFILQSCSSIFIMLVLKQLSHLFSFYIVKWAVLTAFSLDCAINCTLLWQPLFWDTLVVLPHLQQNENARNFRAGHFLLISQVSKGFLTIYIHTNNWIVELKTQDFLKQFTEQMFSVCTYHDHNFLFPKVNQDVITIPPTLLINTKKGGKELHFR